MGEIMMQVIDDDGDGFINILIFHVGITIIILVRTLSLPIKE